MLTRFDPFRDLDQLFEQITTRQPQASRGMPLDLARSKEGYVVAADLPGVDPSSIDLSVEGNVLTIRAERRRGPLDDMQVIATERPVGSYIRQLTLGEGFDLGQVQAEYEDGVLTVTLPVSEAAQPRRIEVRKREKNETVDTQLSEGQNVGTAT